MSPAALAHFSPLDTLTGHGLAQVAQSLAQHRLEPGDTLFKTGDRDDRLYFLLEGQVALESEGSAPILIRAGTDSAAVPLSRLKPRRYTAVATTPATVASVDEDWLDHLLTVDQTTAYEVTEIEGEDPEWMFRLMSSPAFARIPPGNLARMFSRLEPVESPMGHLIIRQGEPGDCYYLIRRGKAHVYRSDNGEKPVLVDTLGSGQGFGEEALLSGDPRNATVVTVDHSLLMRLAKSDFDALLKPALTRRVDAADAANLIGAGARFIDVRAPSEYREYSLPASLNLPLRHLRELADRLDRRRPYITVCQTGRRATAAAFLLNQRGFDVCILDGGLNAVRPRD